MYDGARERQDRALPLLDGRLRRGGPGERKLLHQRHPIGAGPYVLSAVYGGDDNYIGSSSAPQDLRIDQVMTQMQVFPVPGYALTARRRNFFIVGLGGNNNNGNAAGRSPSPPMG